MDFELSEEQHLLQELVRDFARKEIAPQVEELEERAEFPRGILGKLAGLGLMGMTIPSEYGGIRTDSLSLALALEELSKASPSVCVIFSVHCSLFCHALLAFGTEEQKRRYLPPAARGEILGAFSLTEPNAGSDIQALRTTALRRGDRFILNGQKAWITGGSEANALLLFTAAAADQSGKKKLNAFIVERDFPGFKVSKVENKMGLHSSLTVEIALEECEVPAQNLLGGEGRGLAIALQCLDYSRIGIAAQAVGLAQRALEEAIRYAKQREVFGGKVADLQAIQVMIADMATQVEAARLLTHRAAVLKDSGQPFTAQASMAKLFASEAANKIAYQALQIHGGYGYSREFPVERLYRDARVLTLYEGTSEIQRLVIARQLLKDL
jgi:alkylation response protein AidB-like acyl-CoA dehydrogenase